MKLFFENKTNSPVLDLYQKLNKIYPGDGGNCGMLALAIARMIPEVDIIVCCNFDEDLEASENIRDYVDCDANIYHVCLRYKGKLYDCTGQIQIDDLMDIASDQYGDSDPMITAWSYEINEDRDWAFVFRNQTDWNTSAEEYQALISDMIEK